MFSIYAIRTTGFVGFQLTYCSLDFFICHFNCIILVYFVTLCYSSSGISLVPNRVKQSMVMCSPQIGYVFSTRDRIYTNGQRCAAIMHFFMSFQKTIVSFLAKFLANVSFLNRFSLCFIYLIAYLHLALSLVNMSKIGPCTSELVCAMQEVQ